MVVYTAVAAENTSYCGMVFEPAVHTPESGVRQRARSSQGGTGRSEARRATMV